MGTEGARPCNRAAASRRQAASRRPAGARSASSESVRASRPRTPNATLRLHELAFCAVANIAACRIDKGRRERESSNSSCWRGATSRYRGSQRQTAIRPNGRKRALPTASGFQPNRAALVLRIAKSARMPKSSKVVVIAIGAIAGLALVVVAGLALFVSVRAKPRVEAVASAALGLDVKVGGRLTVGFLPALHYVLTDVHVSNHGAEVASVGEVDLAINWRRLLQNEVQIDELGLKRLMISIERRRDGTLNTDRSPESEGTLPALALTRAVASGGVFQYSDKQSGKMLAASDCTLNVSRLQFAADGSPGFLKSLSLAATLACGHVRTTDITGSDLNLSVDGTRGVFDFDPVTVRLFDGRGSGSVHADFSDAVPVYDLRYRLTQFRLDEFFKTLTPKHAGTGLLDFSATLSMRGATTDALVRTAAGEASLRGENLRLEIGDLDKQFSRYQASQKFNLVDVAAFFFVGPLGLGVTKGYDFVRIFQGTDGTTAVRLLVSEWQVEHGVATAKDVALATQANRVALKGGLDFVAGRYVGVTIARVSAKGCAQVRQTVHGPFLSPEVDKPSVLSTLTGPTRRLLRKAESLLGAKCEVFYAGSVPPPK
jgi:hypothetical protein